MLVANDNVLVSAPTPSKISLKARQQAIKICEAAAAASGNGPDLACHLAMLQGAYEYVAELVCLVLESLPIQAMPPSAEQWQAAADKLSAGWEPSQPVGL